MEKTSPKPRAFVAFAGGRARGLVHVGALKALDDRVTIKGVAGTSAGAIVAALRAAGFTADEIVNPQTGETILERMREINPQFYTATALFGPGGWAQIAFLREVFADMTLSRMLAAILLWFGLGAALAVRWPYSASWTEPALYWLACSVAVLVAAGTWCTIGLARLATFQTCLNKLLCRKLGRADNELVYFRDFGRDGRPILKVVASNLSARQMWLFSPDETANTPVAQAVAASICLPFIFAPWRLDTGGGWHAFLDGGLVSNLPAWPFDEERGLDPEALTIAFDIERGLGIREVKTLTWLAAAIDTTLSGAGRLNTRAVAHAELFNLKTDLDLLAFDMRPREVANAVRDAELAAAAAIDKRIFVDPQIYDEACHTARKTVRDALNATRWMFVDGAKLGRIRVGIALPDPDSHRSLRLRFGAGFEGTWDQGALFPIEGSVMGRAWDSGAPWLERRPFSVGVSLSGHENAELRRRIWKGLEWTLCVPIYGNKPERPAFVVTIDGSNPLGPGGSVDRDMFGLAETMRDFFKNVVLRLEN